MIHLTQKKYKNGKLYPWRELEKGDRFQMGDLFTGLGVDPIEWEVRDRDGHYLYLEGTVFGVPYISARLRITKNNDDEVRYLEVTR